MATSPRCGSTAPRRATRWAAPCGATCPRRRARRERTRDPRLIVAAKGPHFSVGLDLKEFGGGLRLHANPRRKRPLERAPYKAVRAMQASVTSIAELAVPVIAAVHGYCIGGGVDLVSACDVRLCANDTKFSVRETKVAIVADLGSLQRLPTIIGAGHLAELAYTGKDIDASRALEIGLVNAVFGRRDRTARRRARPGATRSRRTRRSRSRARRRCSRRTMAEASTRDSSSSRAGTPCTYRAMTCARR